MSFSALFFGRLFVSVRQNTTCVCVVKSWSFMLESKRWC